MQLHFANLENLCFRRRQVLVGMCDDRHWAAQSKNQRRAQTPNVEPTSHNGAEWNVFMKRRNDFQCCDSSFEI